MFEATDDRRAGTPELPALIASLEQWLTDTKPRQQLRPHASRCRPTHQEALE